MGLPVDYPNEPIRVVKGICDFDGEPLTKYDPEAQDMLEEERTKRCMELDMGSSSHSMMERQLQRLIKAITESSDATTQAMLQSNQEWFIAVRAKFNSIYVVVSKTTQERDAIQEFLAISTEPWSRNVQVHQTAIDVGSAKVNSLLQYLSSISFDLNKLPTQVQMQLQ